MTPKISEDLAEAASQQDRPLMVTDAAGKVFVVMTEQQFRQHVYDDGEFQVSDAYPAAEAAFAEGWNAPGMEVYDEDTEESHQADA